MRNSVPVLLAVLAWCCLVCPWQACRSDCRLGTLQPLGHGCHVQQDDDAEQCHCTGHVGDQPETQPGPQPETQPETPSGGALGDHECEGGEHHSLIFPQVEPEAGVTWQPDTLGRPEPFGLATPRCPLPRVRVVRSAVDPPDFEPPARRQLRVDVLLL